MLPVWNRHTIKCTMDVYTIIAALTFPNSLDTTLEDTKMGGLGIDTFAVAVTDTLLNPAVF